MEFSLQTGRINESLGNLSVGESGSNTITISVDPSADDKEVIIKAISNSTEGAGDVESRTVTIGNPIVVIQPTTRVGGGAPPRVVSLPTLPEGVSVLPIFQPLEMILGTNVTLSINITNPFENATLENLTLRITGYPSENLKIEPPILSGIGFGETKEFHVTVIVPPRRGTVYTMNFALAGEVLYSDYPTTKTLTGRVLERENVSLELLENRTMTLIVHSEEPPTYSPTPREVETILQIPNAVELVRGTEVVFKVTVGNPFPNSYLEDLTLIITGYPEEDIVITPELLTRVGHRETGEFVVRISAPTYMERGTYQLEISLVGRLHYPNYPTVVSDISGKPLVVRDITLEISESRVLPLDLFAVSRDEATASLEAAEEAIQSLWEMGFKTNRAERLLRRARLDFENRDYQGAKVLAEEIWDSMAEAIMARDLLEEVARDIIEAEDEKGLKVVDTKNLYNLGLAAFEREDYLTALRRLGEAKTVLALETRGKVNWLKLALDYWYAVLIGSITAILGSLIIYQKMRIALIDRRLNDLWIEEANILGLIHDAQVDYYIEGAMSSEAYKLAMERHEERLHSIRSAMAELRSKRAGMTRVREAIYAPDVLGKLKEERMNLTKLVMQAQDRYYNGPMSSSEYERAINNFESRLAEVDARIAMYEAEMEKRRRKR